MQAVVVADTFQRASRASALLADGSIDCASSVRHAAGDSAAKARIAQRKAPRSLAG